MPPANNNRVCRSDRDNTADRRGGVGAYRPGSSARISFPSNGLAMARAEKCFSSMLMGPSTTKPPASSRAMRSHRITAMTSGQLANLISSAPACPRVKHATMSSARRVGKRWPDRIALIILYLGQTSGILAVRCLSLVRIMHPLSKTHRTRRSLSGGRFLALYARAWPAEAQSKPAVSVLLCAEPKTRTHLNEVNIETLVSTTKLTQALASKILKIYPPALFAR